MYQKAYLVLSLFFFITNCQHAISHLSQDNLNFRGITPSTNYNYKIAHNQIFLQVYLNSLESTAEPAPRWALLDSGSTVNLILSDAMDTQILQVAWLEGSNEYSRLEFHNLGSALPKDYDIVLGAPFFQSHCIVLEYGIPVLIQANLKKKCFIKDANALENEKNRVNLDLYSKNGLVHTEVQIGTKSESMAIDTGSGMSSLPFSHHYDVMKSMDRSILVMDILGNKLHRKLYQLNDSIEMNGIHFIPDALLDSDEVWDRKEGYSSTLGVDFLKTFRVYIDFGSKILGIDRNEYKQGQNHSSNEWGSR